MAIMMSVASPFKVVVDGLDLIRTPRKSRLAAPSYDYQANTVLQTNSSGPRSNDTSSNS